MDRHENTTTGRAIASKVNAQRFPDYFDDENPECVKAWEEEVSQLTAQGWIRLEFGRGGEAHRITRLLLVREAVDEISKALGRMVAQEFVSEISLLLDQASMRHNTSHQEIWSSYLENERMHWTRARISSDSRKRVLSERKLIYEALRLLLARDARTEPVSWRQFSVRHFGDSKALDSLKAEIAGVLYRMTVAQDLDFEEGEEDAQTAVLSDFGVISKERVLYVNGSLRLMKEDGDLLADADQWNPFLPVPEGMLDSCEIDPVSARNVLTVENEESFQILCRQGRRPGWIFLYLGGFPSSGKLRLLKRLSKAGVSIHHWGDLDCGGVEIFRTLERKLGCDIAPLAMGPELLERHAGSRRNLSAAELRRLGILKGKAGPSHPLAPTIDAMLRLESKLEQETVIDPFG